MLGALLWGLVGGSTLVAGALVGCFARLPRRVTAGVMAAGAGVLIASVAYELVDEAAQATTLKHMVVGMALGVTLLHGGVPSVAFIVAVALSNLPEGLSSSVGMRRQGHSVRYVLLVWTAIAVASGIAAAVGYAALGDAPAGTTAFVMSFAAGAVLTMLSSTMLPEAAGDGGPVIGLVTTAGFLGAVLLDRL